MFQELFSLDTNIKKPPKLISTKAYYTDINYFPTVRIRKDPHKIASFYFTPGVDTRYAVLGLDSFRWVDRSSMGNLYLYDSEQENYLFLAPGKTMTERAYAEFTATTGIPTTGSGLPTQDLNEFLQTKPVSNDKMPAALIMSVWEP